MAQLKFYARKDYLVNARPGWTPPYGQQLKRVNRSEPVQTDAGLAQPALPDPFVCEAESDTGRAILHMFRKSSARKDPPLWAADPETARACGVPFVAVELVDGEWIPKASAPPAKPKSPSTASGKA